MPSPEIPSTSSPYPPCGVCGAPLLSGDDAPCPRCLLSLATGGFDNDCEAEMAEMAALREFGDFELLEEIARGGMGVVYRAQQRSLRREVAVKLMLMGELAGPEERRRFHTEALAAAALRHPHIVPVFETGEQDLQPFLVMPFVPGGRNIGTWAVEARKSGRWKEIANALGKVARAVAHAHERGVLHRDLKPSNILWHDADGPQVTDFGLAKLMDAEGGNTLSARMLGSPGYMAPEQTESEDVTTATDVYGLGAVLYEMLAGRPPFTGKSALDTIRKVREESPPPLKNVPVELATICLKCLSKHAADRYASAAAVAQEMERFANGEPVLAVPLPTVARLWRWAQRKPALAALSALTALAILIGVAGVVWQSRKTQQANADLSRTAIALQSTAEALRWKEMDHWLEDGDASRALAFLASRIREQPDRWQAVMYAMSIAEQYRFPQIAGPPVELAVKPALPSRLAPEGTWFAVPGMDQAVRLWDVATGLETKRLQQGSPITALDVAAGPWKLAIGTEAGLLLVHSDVSAEALSLTRGARQRILDLRFSADGSRLLARCQQDVEVWTTASSSLCHIPFPSGTKGARLSADGSRVLVWDANTASIWDADSAASPKALLTVEKREGFASGELAASGKRFTMLDGRFHARTWDVESGQLMPEIESALSPRFYLGLNDSGTRLTLAGWGNDLTVHDTATGLRISPTMRHDYHVESVTPSPDGQSMFTFGWDNILHIWDADTGLPLQAPVRMELGPPDSVIMPSHDGQRALVHRPADKTEQASVSVWRSTRKAPVKRHTVPGFRNFNTGAMSPDGKLGWMGSEVPQPTRCHVYEIATDRVLLDVPTIGEVYSTLFSPDATRCYIVTNQGTVHGFSLTTGQPLWDANQQPGGIIPAAITHDGSRLIAGHRDGHVRIYDTATGKVVHELDGLGEIRTIRLAPDHSGRFVSSGVSGLVHLWQLETGAKLQTFTGHTSIVLASAWSPDCRTIATACADATVLLWDVATGQLRPNTAPLGHIAVPAHLEFSPDGKRLATVTRDGSIRLWNAATGQPQSDPVNQGQACTTVRFTADGAAFFVHDHEGFRFWDAETALPVTIHYPEPVAGGFAFDSEASHQFMIPDGTRVFLSYSMNDGAYWTVPQPRTAPPDWFPGFLESLAQMRWRNQQELEHLPSQPSLAIPPPAKNGQAEEPYAAWARQLMGLPF
jgi:serine/threonine protein kinase/WD40 repeat protein